jgi:hypothetical protein
MDQHEDECFPGTRTELLSQIKKWAQSSQAKPIFWLNGRAGTGKSTISRTVARYFKERKQLGASFFFKRGEGDRGSAKNFFPTIIKQLVTPFPQLIPAIQRALSDEPEIAGKSLKDQFDKLVFQPLLSLETSDTQPTTIVIVVDALDEGERDEDMRLIIHLLTRLRNAKSVSLRVFMTSRPEWPILEEFRKVASHEYQDLILHEVPEPVIHGDISLFLKHQLSEIRKTRFLPKDWPGDANLQRLVHLSVPLFIFAATACRIVKDNRWDPEASLAEILEHENDGSEFDATYRPVLDRFLQGQTGRRKTQLVDEFREIIVPIVMLESPLSVISLSKLLNLSVEEIDRRLSSFHSVLNIPDDPTRPVRIFHLSFRDFLLDPETSKTTLFEIDEGQMHYTLTIRCLKVCQKLRKNICMLESDGTKRVEIDQQTLEQYLPPELRYSCRYWAHHLTHCSQASNALSSALSFLKEHFLHWVEAMSLLGLISDVIGIINILQSAIEVSSMDSH